MSGTNGGCLGWAVALIAASYLGLHVAEATLTPAPAPTARPTPTASLRPTARPTQRTTPKPTTEIGTALVGLAGIRGTFYCNASPPGPISICTRGYPDGAGEDLYAAISPDLKYLTGRSIKVIYRGASVRVRVIDCNCQAHRAIDLYADAFDNLAPLSVGELEVDIEYRP